jgi:hypothetical protein
MHPETKIELIQGRIHVIRGQRVMLDMDLAELYDIDTKTLKRAVRRNTLRFPSDFMFELTLDELGSLRYQIGTLKRGQHVKYQPFAFTEQGVAMLSSVLRSERAIYMNIAIMRASIAVRRMANEHREILEQLAVLTERVGSHDKQLASIYEAIENLLDDKAEQQNWADRERIGFRTSGKNQDKS